MLTSCSAYNCTNRHFKRTTMVFHRFPVNDKELCKKWLAASKRDGFVLTSACYICSDHFTSDDYLFSYSKRLKQYSVPYVFNFPYSVSLLYHLGFYYKTSMAPTPKN